VNFSLRSTERAINAVEKSPPPRTVIDWWRQTLLQTDRRLCLCHMTMVTQKV